MPIHYQSDDEYKDTLDEFNDLQEAHKSKSETSNPENIKEFDDLLKEVWPK